MPMNAANLAGTPTPVTFNGDGKTFQGELYLPENATNPRPLVVVVHGWWGKSKHPIAQARRISDELGYAALAVDLYGDGTTVGTPREAQALAAPFYKDPSLGVERIRHFIAAAPKNSVDVSKIV